MLALVLTVRTYKGTGHPLTVTHYVVGVGSPRLLAASSPATSQRAA